MNEVKLQMGTGKDLARMMSCGIWKEHIISRKDFCSAQIFDNKGKPISLKKAQNTLFCHAKIVFQDCPDDSLKLIEVLLTMVASTSGEQMNSYIFEFYGFEEIIIS